MKMNIPNRLSILRVLLVPVFLLFYYATFISRTISLSIAVVVFAFACFTDFLDGYIARKYNLVTTMGKFLDSIADKILVTTGFLVLCVDTAIMPLELGVVAIVILIFRDYAINMLRQICASYGVVVSADMFGKIKANFQYFTLIFGMILRVFISANLNNTLIMVSMIIFYVAMIITLILTIGSLINYIVKNRATLTKEN